MLARAMNQQPPVKEEVASVQVLPLLRNPLFVWNPFDRSVAEQNQRLPKLSGVHVCTRCALLHSCKGLCSTGAGEVAKDRPHQVEV